MATHLSARCPFTEKVCKDVAKSSLGFRHTTFPAIGYLVERPRWLTKSTRRCQHCVKKGTGGFACVHSPLQPHPEPKTNYSPFPKTWSPGQVSGCAADWGPCMYERGCWMDSNVAAHEEKIISDRKSPYRSEWGLFHIADSVPGAQLVLDQPFANGAGHLHDVG